MNIETNGLQSKNLKIDTALQLCDSLAILVINENKSKIIQKIYGL